MTKNKHYTEAEILELSGYSRQTLLNMRKGRISGKYAYPPRLETPEHFIIFGRTIMYTEKGKDIILNPGKKHQTSPEQHRSNLNPVTTEKNVT